MAFTVDSILKLPASKKAVILGLFLGIITAFYFYSFFTPRRQELARLQGDLDNVMKELNEAKTITRDLQRFKDQVTKMEEELTKALTQLPNEKEIPEILKNLTSLVRESNLEFTLFRPRAEQPQQFIANVPIELVLLGNYHNTGIFFDRVSKLPRIINVVDFSMTGATESKGKADSNVLVRTSCLVNTYRFIAGKSEVRK